MSKKNKKYSVGKRKYFKNNFDEDESEELFEDKIFEDDFTNNRIIPENKLLKKEDFDDEIEDSKDIFEEDILTKDRESFADDILTKDRESFADDHNEYQKTFAKDHIKNNFVANRTYNNKNQMESKGQTIISAAAAILLMGVGIPVLLIFYLSSPPLDQDFFILGIYYSKILFTFFISAAIMVYTSFFFLRSRQFIVIPVFLLSLLCCFPFIAGLRSNLTVMQAILDLKLFSNWPFFLKPTYLFFEFLIPFGVIIYLFLQIKSIFSKKKHSYAYLCIALYLSIASSIGFSILTRTGQPNIASLIAPHIEATGIFNNINITGLFELNTTIKESGIINKPEIITKPELITKPEIIAQPEFINTPENKSHDEASATTLSEILPDNQENKKAELELELETKFKADLEPKLEPAMKSEIETELKPKIETELKPKIESELKPKIESELKELEELRVKSTSNLNSNKTNTNQTNLADVEKELRDVSAKLDMILEKLSQEKTGNIKKTDDLEKNKAMGKSE
ncbi:MAG: hypothetical protein HQK67_05880 [Desulfamplus sp.]|nr:hypothetical protein [Desulfamplus sp.]